MKCLSQRLAYSNLIADSIFWYCYWYHIFSATNIFHLTRKYLEEGVLHARLAPEIWALSHIVEKWGARPGQDVPQTCFLQIISPCSLKSLYCPSGSIDIAQEEGHDATLTGEEGRDWWYSEAQIKAVWNHLLWLLVPLSLLLCSFPQTLHSFKCYWISVMYQALCYALEVQWD